MKCAWAWALSAFLIPCLPLIVSGRYHLLPIEAFAMHLHRRIAYLYYDTCLRWARAWKIPGTISILLLTRVCESHCTGLREWCVRLGELTESDDELLTGITLRIFGRKCACGGSPRKFRSRSITFKHLSQSYLRLLSLDQVLRQPFHHRLLWWAFGWVDTTFPRWFFLERQDPSIYQLSKLQIQTRCYQFSKLKSIKEN